MLFNTPEAKYAMGSFLFTCKNSVPDIGPINLPDVFNAGIWLADSEGPMGGDLRRTFYRGIDGGYVDHSDWSLAGFGVSLKIRGLSGDGEREGETYFLKSIPEEQREKVKRMLGAIEGYINWVSQRQSHNPQE